eukprot:CAMPEP_0178991758 /NCGR_PEP_ID=MMETSP0795-20121207/5717_1 /TAXON_ID=88552 /ORGANISM="Amoebophrya sp., Strain Ameob2" /LENGTH=791 /DNA_ID=CAMNT_0020683525 /DNA_START=116 /DNA_END=2490 /DNA_ORIENTATION=-
MAACFPRRAPGHRCFSLSTATRKSCGARMLRFPHAFVTGGSDGVRFLGEEEVKMRVGEARLLWFGEYHSEKRICELLQKITAGPMLQPQEGGGGALHQNREGPRFSKWLLVMEHFSSDMQQLLDSYFKNTEDTNFAAFAAQYREIGTEGHDLAPYEPLFEQWRNSLEVVRVVGGFPPRPLAAAFTKLENATERVDYLQTLMADGYLPPAELMAKVERIIAARNSSTRGQNKCRASDLRSLIHEEVLPVQGDETGGKSGLSEEEDQDNFRRTGLLYASVDNFRLFESLMSGRDVYAADGGEIERITAVSPLLRMFGAQSIKDWAMAWNVHRQRKGMKTNEDAKLLVVAGKAHLHHYKGVPECLRLLQEAEADGEVGGSNKELLLLSQMMYECDLDEADEKRNPDVLRSKISAAVANCMGGVVGGLSPGAKPYADILYVYDEDDDGEEWGDDADVLAGDEEKETLADLSGALTAKFETLDAYNKVGATAATAGNLRRAKKWMTCLHYTETDFEAIGERNLYNFQGVGNPFLKAKIRKGEAVLELGCGLGVDAFLAASKTGTQGTVTAVDFAEKELEFVRRRAAEEERGKHLKFMTGDIEKLSSLIIEPESFDVCISNGAFCLIPDKRKAFGNVYKALKSGGRCAICTTTMKLPLNKMGKVQDHAPAHEPDRKVRDLMLAESAEAQHVEGPGDAGLRKESECPEVRNESEYPVCMRMFANLNELQPMLEQIGFRNVAIEEVQLDEWVFDSDEEEDNNNAQRFKIHGGRLGEKYEFLEKMNVDDMCAAVVVYAEK